MDDTHIKQSGAAGRERVETRRAHYAPGACA